MAAANADEIAELLGDRADEAIIERIVELGASLDEISEALDDVEQQLRFGEEREPASPRIEEVRRILEELPRDEEPLPDSNGDGEEELEGLTVIDPDDLIGER